MTAEHYSASLASRLATTHNHQPPQGYYRSKLFIVPSAANPLVAAAGPLFSLLERLSISPTLPDITDIRNNIEHELNAFHSRLGSLSYTQELVSIAHYLLSATIDELLGKNYLRLHGYPAEFNAFTPSSFDEIGPQRRFFDIVNYIKERTNQYMDLVELAYYCLIAGFEGEQHLRANGRQELDNTIEELYQLIQHNRVNKPYMLFAQCTPAVKEPKNHKSLLIFASVALAFLVFLYLGSHALLEQKAKTVLHGHATLTHLDAE